MNLRLIDEYHGLEKKITGKGIRLETLFLSFGFGVIFLKL